jgi:hypothetical protein
MSTTDSYPDLIIPNAPCTDHSYLIMVANDTGNGSQAEITTKPIVEARASRWTTTRFELWTYYLYYIGNNGLSGFNFGPSQFQNLLFLAGYDPTAGPGTACGTHGCVLPYLGKIRDSKLCSYAESKDIK